MAAAIEIEGLHKTYRRLRGGSTTAVDGLDLSIPDGGVFGFLGPNGSGKTTTIRCLLGLIRPSSGNLSMLGEQVPRHLPRVIKEVGAIVETPSFFPNFSAYKNLSLLAAIDGIRATKVLEVLELVGLEERANEAVKGYSLGMRQRLGLASALLKDPQLLILDEPANGLDPAGIREIRKLMKRLGTEGRTVFLSSHILSEIEQTCDNVAILSKGKCVATGSVDEVIRSTTTATLKVKLTDLSAGSSVLTTAGFEVESFETHLLVKGAQEHPEQITKTLASAGLWLTELQPHNASLEDTFLELTNTDETISDEENVDQTTTESETNQQ